MAPQAIGGEGLMGKVYDALRRAEAERSERLGVRPPDPLVPGLELGREGRAPAPRRFWRRWLRTRPPLEEPTAANKRRISMLRPDSFVSEQFRTLRARIDSIAAQHPLRTIAFTSALPGEGKSVAAVNLALVSSMSVGRRVLLIDCDLRRPRVHATLGLVPENGLAEVLTDEAGFSQSVLKVEGFNLEVLGVRTQPPNPSELLASDRMRQLIDEASGSYDRVILDVPPTLLLPDAKTVADLADGVVLVVRADSTASDDVEAALEILDRRRIVGVVLNGVDDPSDRYGYPV
jgi:capsular exopolysaccharide synthesis family protein